MSKRLLLNSASGALLYLLNLAIVFVLSPIVVSTLGNRDYGVWEMLLSFAGYFGILEVGLGPALIRYIAREEALGNHERLSRILNSAFWGLSCVGLLGLLTMILLSLKPETVLGISPGEIDRLPTLFIIAGFTIMIQFIGTVFSAFLLGRQRHLTVNVFRCFLYPIKALFIVIALKHWEGQPLVHLAAITLASSICQYAFFAYLTLRSQGETLRPGAFSAATARELYKFGFKSFVLLAADRIQSGSLPIVIGHVIGASSVVFFVMPRRLIDYLRRLVLAIGVPLMPYISSIDASRRSGDRMTQWFPLSRAISCVSVPAATMVLGLGEPFLGIWLGPAYAEGGRWVIALLALSFLVSSLFFNANRVLVAGNRHGRPARTVLLISVVSLSASIPVARFCGVTGVAAVLAISDLAANAVQWYAASAYIGIGLSEHLRVTALPLVIPVLLLALVLISGRVILPISGYVDLLLIMAVAGVVYVSAAIRFALTPSERRAIRTKMMATAFRRPA